MKDSGVNVRPVVAIALCIVANYFAALVILSTRWGSVFMLDDDFHNSSIVVSIAVGLVLGLVQSAIFTPQITITAAAIGLIGVATVLLAFTLATQAIGIGIGCILAWLPRRQGIHIRRRGVET